MRTASSVYHAVLLNIRSTSALARGSARGASGRPACLSAVCRRLSAACAPAASTPITRVSAPSTPLSVVCATCHSTQQGRFRNRSLTHRQVDDISCACALAHEAKLARPSSDEARHLCRMHCCKDAKWRPLVVHALASLSPMCPAQNLRLGTCVSAQSLAHRPPQRKPVEKSPAGGCHARYLPHAVFRAMSPALHVWPAHHRKPEDGLQQPSVSVRDEFGWYCHGHSNRRCA